MSNIVSLFGNNPDKNTRSLMADTKFYSDYSRYNDEKGRYETWDEATSRVMNMHREYYADKITPELDELMDEIQVAYRNKEMLGSQRALQFGGEQLLARHMKLYNCSSTYADRDEYFGQFFWVLLCGAGVGVSVSKIYTEKMSKIQKRTKQSKIHVIEDSIEGWATAADVLMSSYFIGGGKYPEYEGRRVYFDMSQIRPKGAHISGGFKAPGPEPLRKALDRIENLLDCLLEKEESPVQMRPIHIYDISMHIADSVISGGVRRSACIFLFDHDDEEMMQAKTGNWFEDNPQRARSNNSAILIRDEIQKEDFDKIFESTRQFGEPGFAFMDSKKFAYNPCFEIGMYPQTESGESGFSVCNLTEINGSKCNTPEDFYHTCRMASALGTIQAGYTDFDFLGPVSEEIIRRESLIGVSITGWMNNPKVLFDEDVLREGARIVKETNMIVSKMIGINPAARTTAVKPSGNASVLLETTSGIHAEHSARYIRNIQLNKESEVAQLIKKANPYMVEESVWNANGSDYVISFPIISPEDSVYKDQLFGINLLEKVKMVQQVWIEEGTNEEFCVDPRLRHNVSNTVTVLPNQWDDVREYLFENRYYFAGVSFLSNSGDYDYIQAPFTQILTEDEIIEEYGRGAMFASGLIVDSNKGFPNLWTACSVAQQTEDTGDQEQVDARADWVRRFKNYAANYFHGNMKRAEYCLKAVHLLHRWAKIQQTMTDISFVTELEEKRFVDVDTLGAQNCSGGQCEITF